MNDYSAEQAQAFTPEQMAQLLFSVKAVMAQQQVLADFPAGTFKICRLLDVGQQTGNIEGGRAGDTRREN